MLKHKFSIKIHIGSLFLCLILTLGAILAWFNYLKTSEILLSTSDKLFDNLASEVDDSFKVSYLPVVSNIELLATTELPDQTTYQQRQAFEPALLSILDNNPHTAAISLGYPSGDYFIIRSMISDAMRQTFDAPKTSHYMIDHIDGQTKPKQIERRFLNQQKKLIGTISFHPTSYNPTERPWYVLAHENQKTVATEPYLFYFIGKLGITISYRDPDSGTVIAADVTLSQISEQLSDKNITPNSSVIIIDKETNIVAYQDASAVIRKDKNGQLQQAKLSYLNKPELNAFLDEIKQASANQTLPLDVQLKYKHNGSHWYGKKLNLKMSNGQMALLLVTPEHELLQKANSIRNSSTFITAFILVLSLPLTWLLANRVARPIIALTSESERIKDLDFTTEDNTHSFVLEIDSLSGAMNDMKATINRFITLVNVINSEKDHEKLIERVTKETRKASQADIAAIYLYDDEKKTLTTSSIDSEQISSSPTPHASTQKSYQLNDQPEAIRTAINAQKVHSQQYTASDNHQFNLINDLSYQANTMHGHLVSIPLENRKKELIGVLVMIFETAPDLPFISKSKISFAQALSGFCAESIEKNRLYRDQKQLLESFIKLMAGAIDAKSPYTGGHCQRVPELAKRITQAACDDNSEAFKNFSMSEDDWEALHIASWLHDCGKVTTPEYVVDKATRLESLYNRIHEVRTRFEVLKRDAIIDYHKQCLELSVSNQLTKEKQADLSKKLEQQLDHIDQDFAFIGECNSGDTFMSPDNVDRLNNIAQNYTWQRTISDRIGLSWEEAMRKSKESERPLPITEHVLADRYDHIIEKNSSDTLCENNSWGFKMKAPDKKFNLGEIYNLTAKAGTLTNEERFIINDHIIQTIIMLDTLPFPKHLKQVPEIAGNHHEKIDGTGYPRKLTGDQMSIPSKVMALADIFEALTASDRPYKDAKPLSVALKIMKNMANDGHIDPSLFKLFIEKEVYLDYANAFLEASQIDLINTEDYLS